MSSETKQILTTDGIPLEVSLKKAEKKNKIKAFLLVAPLLLFLIITYVFPIGEMFSRSIDDKMITNMLPKTFKEMEKWDGKELPPEEVFAAFYYDYKSLPLENLIYGFWEFIFDSFDTNLPHSLLFNIFLVGYIWRVIFSSILWSFKTIKTKN